MPKVLPNLYDRFTNCSYHSLAPPSTRQLPIAASTTTTWSNTTIGNKDFGNTLRHKTNETNELP